MVRSRVRLHVVAAGIALRSVAASASTALNSQLVSSVDMLPTIAGAPDSEEEPNDSYKSNPDWWRDPFAAFEDEEDDLEERQTGDEEQSDGDTGDLDVLKETGVKQNDDEKEVLVVPDMDVKELLLIPDVNIMSALPSREDRGKVDGNVDGKDQVAPEDTAPDVGKQIYTENKLADGSLAAPLAFLIRSLPKVQEILGHSPVVKVVAAFAVAKALYEPVLSFSTQISKPAHEDTSDPPIREFMESEMAEEQDEDVSPRRVPRQRTTRLLQEGGAKRNEMKFRPSRWFENIIGKSNVHEKLPSSKELMERVQMLEVVTESAVSDRDMMEREYEKASWQVRTLCLVYAQYVSFKRKFNDQSLVLVPLLLRQLQEAQTELSSLTSSTRYLKAQLRDNEAVMDRALKAERIRAKEELTRMKDAMLVVLERERKAMRTELMRQTAELKTLLQDDRATHPDA